jgi:hypothetical protein
MSQKKIDVELNQEKCLQHLFIFRRRIETHCTENIHYLRKKSNCVHPSHEYKDKSWLV